MKQRARSTGFALAFALVAGLLSGTATPAQAQISLEARGSLQYPVSEFGDVAESDAGLGADVFYNLSPALSVYGGYAWERFGCEGCGEDDHYSTMGFEAGAKFLFTRQGKVLPWARVGAVLQELEIDTGPVVATSDWGLGLQASAGLDIPLGEMLSFSPAIRYQTWNADVEPIDGVGTEEEVSFLSLDLGLHIHPGG